VRAEKLGRIAGAGAALAIPFLPKCPLCVLPLFAAAGMGAPRGPLVEILVAAAVLGWLGMVLTSARWLPVRLAASSAASMILFARLVSAGWLAACGSALMLAVALWTWRRPGRCDAACHAPESLARP
jgi:hypothetical protein